MRISQILILAAIAVGIGLLPRGRALTLAGVSMLLLFWLTPPNRALPSLPFWLQIFSSFSVVIVWWIVTPPEARRLRDHWPVLAVLSASILLATFANRLPIEEILPVSTPNPIWVLSALIGLAGFIFVVNITGWLNRVWATLGITAFLAVFVVIKSPSISAELINLFPASHAPKALPDATITFAWLGYSYLAFRLLHVLRDWQAGLYATVKLDEFISYALFFPSISAGPIDRVERFTADLRRHKRLTNEEWLFAGQRLVTGLFKKFVLADWLARWSLSDALVVQAQSGAWLWLFIYAYAFRLYFDFSGYTDIAIGLGKLVGIRLPENFASPYLKSNLTQFWNSWHMTLTQWFRSYVFNPLARFFRARRNSLPSWFVLFVAQSATMSLIGLWHGVTWNYLAWGMWQAVGLFIQYHWSEWVRIRFQGSAGAARWQPVLKLFSVVITFHYITLSYVFIALSSMNLSVTALLRLFGIS